MNWCIENKVVFLKDFIQYLLAIGFTIEETCNMISTDPELHHMMMQIRMCFTVNADRIPATDLKDLS